VSSPRHPKPGRPRKRPAAELRALILAAARKNFTDTGLRAATIEQIATTAGVTRQAVYEHFEDKNALFDAVLRDVLTEAAGIFEQLDKRNDVTDLGWTTRRYVDAFEFYQAHPDHQLLIQEADRVRHPAAVAYGRKVDEVNAAALRAYWKQLDNGLDAGRAPELMAHLASALVHAVLDTSWNGPPPDAQTLGELLAVFSAGGMGTLVKHAPELIKRLD